MIFGKVPLYCPMCGAEFELTPLLPSRVYRSSEWGHVCSPECYEFAGLTYARMILGKDTERKNSRETALCKLREALRPFARFGRVRLQVFGTNSTHSFLTPVIDDGKVTAQLTREDWERAMRTGEQC